MRASVYLTDKAKALSRAIEFFTATAKGNAKERRLIFLAQIDFWDWEMDNLIYSFETFAERAKAWSSMSSVEMSLQHLGIKVGEAVLRDAKFQGICQRNWYRPNNPVTAPLPMINDVIDQWNALLTACEKYIPEKVERYIELFGANLLPNLSKYKKKHLTAMVPQKA